MVDSDISPLSAILLFYSLGMNTRVSICILRQKFVTFNCMVYTYALS